MVMEENHLDPKAPIGVDKIDGQLMAELTKRGYKLGDGEEIMCAAREIKNEDEIQIMMRLPPVWTQLSIKWPVRCIPA